MKTINILSLLLSFSLWSCQSQAQNMSTVDVATFDELIKKETKPQLLDVRTPAEFADKNIPNAKNINWNDASFLENVASLDKSKPVFVYCLSGGRSKSAATKLAENGFTKVYDLKGGILKWNASHETKAENNETEKIVGICAQEYTEMLQTSAKTIVNIYGKQCAPCKKMEPYILKMQQELKGKINLVRYDSAENKTIMKTLKVDELPVILIYEGNKLIYRHAGYLSETDLRKQIL